MPVGTNFNHRKYAKNKTTAVTVAKRFTAFLKLRIVYHGTLTNATKSRAERLLSNTIRILKLGHFYGIHT